MKDRLSCASSASIVSESFLRKYYLSMIRTVPQKQQEILEAVLFLFLDFKLLPALRSLVKT